MENKKNNNAFTITWISCLLMMLLFVGALSARGTRACYYDPDKKAYVGSDCNNSGIIGNGTGGNGYYDPSSGYVGNPDPENPNWGGSTGGGASFKPSSSNNSGGNNGNVGVSGYQTAEECIKVTGGACGISGSDKSYYPLNGYSNSAQCLSVTGKSCKYYANGLYYPDYSSSSSSDSSSDITTTKQDNGASTVTIKKSDGTVLQYNYDADGNLMSIITTDADGNQKIDTTEYSNAVGGVNVFYNNYNECYYMSADNGSDCVLYKDTYIPETLADRIIYTDEDLCKQTTGGNCRAIVNPESGDTTYVADDCVCEDNGDCVDEPTPTPANPTKPTIPSTPTSPSNPSNNPSNPSSNPSTPDENVENNPQTGTIMMLIVFGLGLCAVFYSIYYFMKVRKEN